MYLFIFILNSFLASKNDSKYLFRTLKGLPEGTVFETFFRILNSYLDLLLLQEEK